MKIQTATVAEKGFVKGMLKGIMTVHSKHQVYDVAKVLFGEQPGDRIAYSPEIAFMVVPCMHALSSAFEDFEIVHVNEPRLSPVYKPGTILYYNRTALARIDGWEQVLEKMVSQAKADRAITREEAMIGKHKALGIDHVASGRFYGFPECCIEAFGSGKSVPVGAGEYGRYLEHAPCSDGCHASYDMAERYRPILEFVEDIERGADRTAMNDWFERLTLDRLKEMKDRPKA